MKNYANILTSLSRGLRSPLQPEQLQSHELNTVENLQDKELRQEMLEMIITLMPDKAMSAMAKQILSPILFKASDDDLKETITVIKSKIDGIYEKYCRL